MFASWLVDTVGKRQGSWVMRGAEQNQAKRSWRVDRLWQLQLRLWFWPRQPKLRIDLKASLSSISAAMWSFEHSRPVLAGQQILFLLHTLHIDLACNPLCFAWCTFERSIAASNKKVLIAPVLPFSAGRIFELTLNPCFQLSTFTFDVKFFFQRRWISKDWKLSYLTMY